MTVLWLASGIAIVAGLSIGVTIRNAARRRGGTPAEAKRNQNLVISIAMLVAAVILGWVTATDAHHRAVNIVVVVLMVVTAVWQLVALRRRTSRT